MNGLMEMNTSSNMSSYNFLIPLFLHYTPGPSNTQQNILVELNCKCNTLGANTNINIFE